MNRMDSTARSAYPRAHPNSAIAVEKFTSTVLTGRNGRTTAATNPATSDAATAPPMPERLPTGTGVTAAPVLLGAVSLRNLMTGHLELPMWAPPPPYENARNGAAKEQSDRMSPLRPTVGDRIDVQRTAGMSLGVRRSRRRDGGVFLGGCP